jgi:hypothetical protein
MRFLMSNKMILPNEPLMSILMVFTSKYIAIEFLNSMYTVNAALVPGEVRLQGKSAVTARDIACIWTRVLFGMTTKIVRFNA